MSLWRVYCHSREIRWRVNFKSCAPPKRRWVDSIPIRSRLIFLVFSYTSLLTEYEGKHYALVK